MSITSEEQLRLSACIEEIAQILYKNTASEEIATLEGLEKVVRQQMLEYVSPKVALFYPKSHQNGSRAIAHAQQLCRTAFHYTKTSKPLGDRALQP
jgi:hypothetical protein